jgi:F-type H+-transporting ATPase subunit beta
MTSTTVEAEARRDPAPAKGRVARVIGPVVDVEFPGDAIPDIYNALTTEIELAEEGAATRRVNVTLEVEQHLGDNLVRAISMKPTDGLVRGAEVRDTGGPI